MGWEERLRSARARALTRAPLQAICKRFWEFCAQRGVELRPGAFIMSYETCIPRQAGLSGSSAIVCAALSCLLDFYGVAEECVPAGAAHTGSGCTCFTVLPALGTCAAGYRGKRNLHTAGTAALTRDRCYTSAITA